MKKNYLNTLVAIIVLAALWGGFTYWNKRQARKAAAKPASTTTEKLLPLESSHIESFVLTSRDGKSLTCSRQGKDWAITDPKDVPADQSKISSFLDSLTSATVDEVVEPHAPNLKDFGLDPPGEAIRVSTNSKPARFTLLLGDDTPTPWRAT